MVPLLTGLDKVPRHAYPFLWAVYVELLCLCGQNGFVSKGNIDAITQEAGDVQSDSVEALIGDMESEDLDDSVSQRWADIHARLTARSKQYQDCWPFVLEPGVLRSRFDGSNPGHRLYAALLIASSLRLCTKKRAQEVTDAFEEISYHWLRGSLNDLWEVRPFGAHQKLPNAYQGSLLEKLKALAKDIRARLQKEDADYDPRNTGDGGIDLVAWFNMGDQRGNMPVIFGQCACSPTDWEDKQLDVTPAAIEGHLAPHHPGAAYCFVPHDLSANDSRWDRSEHVKRTVLIDRLRFLKLFERNSFLARLPTWAFVDEAVGARVTLAT